MLFLMFVVTQVHASATGSAGAQSQPLPPLVWGGSAFCIVLALLALTFAFRSVGKRH